MAGAPYGWADGIQPYLKSTQILQCPSETNTIQANFNTLPVPGTATNYTDYWANALALGNSQSAMNNVALTVFAGDGNGAGATARYMCNGTSCSNDGTVPPNPNPALVVPPAVGTPVTTNGGMQRHLETANILFADGHVKSLKGQSDVINGAMVNNMTGDNSGGKATFQPS